MATNSPKVSILFLGSSPIDEDQLALNKEFEEISEGLHDRAQEPDQFTLVSRWRVQAVRLPSLIRRYKPNVLHFSGHGLDTGELLFEDEWGRAAATEPGAVARVFELHGGTVRCVVLNACYSQAQALLIAEHVDVVIGMSRRVSDQDAHRFAKGLYECFGAGLSVAEAFEQAKLQIWLAGSVGKDTPILHAREGVDPKQIFVHEHGGVDGLREPPEYLFVAHAPTDKLQVLTLCRDLIDRGVRPWLDMWDLPPGGDWCMDIQAALRRAPAVLICKGRGGSGAENFEYGRSLSERLDQNRNTVYHVALPGASGQCSSLCEGLESVSLNDERWGEGVADLAALVGVDDERRSWLEYEARSVEGEVRPYRGLEAFEERDARWMFGRSEETAELLALIDAGETRFLTVIGASGSGKSSLVMAGLCPLLRSGALTEGRVWRIAYLRPGLRPCEALAGALVDLQIEAGAKEDAVSDAKKVTELRDEMLKSPDALRLVVDRMLSSGRRGERPGTKVALIVDQLEEVFTEAENGHAEICSDEADAFIRNLREATTQLDSLWVVSTLRADFVQRCLEVGELARALKGGIYFALLPMRAEQVRAAVEQPARRVGFEVERKVVDELLRGAAEHAGRLPLLQHVLGELWQQRDDARRSLSAVVYAEVGGLEGAIATAADRALARLTKEIGKKARMLTRHVMTRLVHLGKGVSGDTRRRATLTDLGDDAETRAVLDAFVRGERVLVASEVEGVEVFELAHEALLREWSTLADWLDDDRGALALRQELTRNAEELAASKGDPEYLWAKGRVEEARRIFRGSTVELNDEEEGFLVQSDRKARARQRRLVFMVSLAFVALLGLLGIVGRLAAENERRADDNERLAKEKTKLAEDERMQRELAEDGINAQKGLRASMLANGRMDLEPVLLGIEAMGAYSPPVARLPPLAAYAGLLDALDTEGIVGERAKLEGHSKAVRALAFSPDGSHLVTGSDDSTARLWDVPSGKEVARLQSHTGPVRAVAFSPDGTYLATASSDSAARLWDVPSGKEVALLEGHSGAVMAVAFSPDGSRLATASSDSTTRLWDVPSGKEVAKLEGHTGPVRAVAFSPDGSRLATASSDSTARLWDIQSSKEIAKLEGHSNWVRALAFSPDGSRLATASSDSTARLWDVQFGKEVARFEGHSKRVIALAFSPDGSRLATASDDSTARLWDVQSSKEITKFEGHSSGVRALAFSLDGSHLATTSDDSTARLWDIQSGREIAKLEGHSGAVGALAFSPDGSRYATGGDDSTARLWDIHSTSKVVAKLEGHSGAVRALAFSPDGSRLATVSSDSIARLWDIQSGKEIAEFEGHSGAVRRLAVSPDGSRLAIATDRSTSLWDTQSGEEVARLEGHSGAVWALAFSPDGSRLATVSSDSTARLWGVQSGKEIAEFEGHSGAVLALAFSPDGSRLATASNDSTARLWDVQSGKGIAEFEGHSSAVKALAFSPDGSRLATVGSDSTARIWDVQSGEEITKYQMEHFRGVRALVFLPDGLRLAIGREVWDVKSDKKIADFKGHSDTVRAWAFSSDGSRLATTSDGSTIMIWLMPHLALEFACARTHGYLDYARVAEICDRVVLGVRTGPTIDVHPTARLATDEALPELCPNGRCELTEDCNSCPQDCGNCNTEPVDAANCEDPRSYWELTCKLKARCMACFDLDAEGRGTCRGTLDKLTRPDLVAAIRWATSSRHRCRANMDSIVNPLADMIMELHADDTFTEDDGSLSLGTVKRVIGRPPTVGYDLGGLEVRVKGGSSDQSCWGGLSDFIWDHDPAWVPPTCCTGARCRDADYSCSTEVVFGLARTCSAL